MATPRKRFESYLEELRDHEDVVPIFCFRANLKYVPKTKDDKLRMSTGEQRADQHSAGDAGLACARPLQPDPQWAALRV